MNQLLTKKQIAQAKEYCTGCADYEVDPRVEALVNELIGRVADKWTMLVIEALVAGGEMRFTRIADAIITGELTKVEDVVPLIRFLASEGWWITGQTIFINGGFTTR